MWESENMKTRKSESAKMRKCGNATRAVLCPLSIVLCLAANATGVRMAHDIVLKGGWNAFYLPVTPDVTCDRLFGDWPTDMVGCYDPEAYLRTKQFDRTADDSTQGAISPRYKVWVRGDALRSTLLAPPGDAVYIVNITNANGFTARVVGEPRAMRNVWHPTTGGNVPVNYLGISTDGARADLTADGYLMGLDTGWISRWTVGGRATAEKPTLTAITRDAAVDDGAAVAMDAMKASEWSGPLHVSPATGIDLGTNATRGVLSVRNDSGTNRVVQVAFAGSADGGPGHEAPAVPEILSFDAGHDTTWTTNAGAGVVIRRELAAGETLSLMLAVDRTRLTAPAGGEYGGILEVTDVSADRCTHFRTAVPFSVRSDGGAFESVRWPKGLWRTEITLDRVSGFGAGGATAPVAAGAAMNVRVLMHVDANGAMNLVPRVRLNGRRISSAVLPTDRPAVAAGGDGTFGKDATFEWTVGGDSRVNPFYHAKHPDHDGLLSDFRTPAPNGDDFANYNADVKPELFSVANAVTFGWDAKSGAAPWNPEETLTGTCVWKLKGLRREGAIETRGTFTMKRISEGNLEEMRDE